MWHPPVVGAKLQLPPRALHTKPVPALKAIWHCELLALEGAWQHTCWLC